MFYKTEGIVLHGLKYGDSGKIVTIYTEAFGRCTFVMQGIHAKKSSSKANLLQPLFLLELEVDYRQGRELQRAREIRIKYPYQSVPYDVVKYSQAIFLGELLHKVLKEEESREELFQFLSHSFQLLDLLQNGAANFHLLFLFHLSRYMGFAPTNNYTLKNPYFDLIAGSFGASIPLHSNYLELAESRIFSEIMGCSFDRVEQIVLSAPQRNACLQKVIDYYSMHLGIRLHLKSLEVLREIFS